MEAKKWGKFLREIDFGFDKITFTHLKYRDKSHPFVREEDVGIYIDFRYEKEEKEYYIQCDIDVSVKKNSVEIKIPLLEAYIDKMPELRLDVKKIYDTVAEKIVFEYENNPKYRLLSVYETLTTFIN